MEGTRSIRWNRRHDSAYEGDHDLLSGQLRTLEADAWYQQAWLIQGNEDILLKDTIGGLLWIALFDFVHHRGQLSTYIRRWAA